MKKYGIATILASVMLLTACGKDTEIISGTGTSTQSTVAENNSSSAPASSSGTAESNTSSLTESSSDTSSEPIEEPPQPEMIPLTKEELHEISISPMSIQFFKSYERNSKSFDYTASIDDVEMLDFVFTRLLFLIETDEADHYENVEDHDSMDGYTEYYYFTPETAEKLIQEKFFPSFKISSVDYTKSTYWDREIKQFKTAFREDAYHGGGLDSFYLYLSESGYRIDDCYYINLVPLCDYFGEGYFRIGEVDAEHLKLSDIASVYFDIPRVQVKLKKFNVKSHWDTDYMYDYYAFVGFEPVDNRPEWVNTAEQLFKDNDLENVEMIGLTASEENNGFNTLILRTAGVLSTPFGKRIYLYEKHYTERNLYHDYYHAINTFGTRGKNDNIQYLISSGSREGAGDYTGSQYHYIEDSTLTCNDVLSGVKYIHTVEEGFVEYYDIANNYRVIDRKDVHEESWKMNDKDISEAEYNSAEAVVYFLDNFDGDGKYDPYEFDTLYSCEVTDCITLGDYFEMCRIITE